MNENLEILIQKAKEFNINLTDQQIKQFNEYWKFLFEYNKHTNLVGSAEFETVVIKHFADSLSIGLLQEELSLNTKKTFLDIGIGGGFPGIPIIIAFPELKLCAVDSVGKKTEFLKQLAKIINIEDRVEIINARAEELNKQETFDFAVSRAVSKLNILLEYSLPFVKVGGYFISYKAKTFLEEIQEAQSALKILGGEVFKTVNYTLSGEERNLILVRKIKTSFGKYPRKTGVPKKNPL